MVHFDLLCQIVVVWNCWVWTWMDGIDNLSVSTFEQQSSNAALMLTFFWFKRLRKSIRKIIPRMIAKIPSTMYRTRTSSLIQVPHSVFIFHGLLHFFFQVSTHSHTSTLSTSAPSTWAPTAINKIPAAKLMMNSSAPGSTRRRWVSSIDGTMIANPRQVPIPRKV